MAPIDGSADGFELIEYEADGDVAVLRIQRPEKKNAINFRMREEIAEAVAEFDDGDEAVLVLTGTADAFSAGTDINDIEDKRVDSIESVLRRDGFDLPEHLEALDKPVIAMINGCAVGGGCELALACDVRVAASNAKIGLPEITLGGLPGEGGTQRLPREISTGDAMYLVLTGEPVDATEAKRLGLVQKVYDPDELEPETMDLARGIADRDLANVVLAKKAVELADRTDLPQGIELEELLAGINSLASRSSEKYGNHLDG